MKLTTPGVAAYPRNMRKPCGNRAENMRKMIQQTRSVANFFHECVAEAMRAQKVQASELAASYLVSLLSELAGPRSEGKPTADPMRITLVELLLAANQAEGPAKARRFREVGDTALLSTGVCRAALLSRGMDLNYYYAVGGSAYQTAAQLHRFMRGQPLDELCEELGGKLPSLSDVLDEVMALTYEHGATGLLRLLNRYRRTGSAWVRRHLAERGFWPGNGTLH